MTVGFNYTVKKGFLDLTKEQGGEIGKENIIIDHQGSSQKAVIQNNQKTYESDHKSKSKCRQSSNDMSVDNEESSV